MRLLRGCQMALGLLTTIPMPHAQQSDMHDAGMAVFCYPLVGLLLGVIVYVAYTLMQGFLPESYLRVLLFALFIALTGGIHLDGLADVLDATLSRDPQRMKEILKDPRIGSLGAVFLFTALLLKLAGFVHLEPLHLLLLIPMVSRWGAALAIYHSPYITQGGMGEQAKLAFTATLLIATSLIVLGIASFVAGFWVALFCMGATLVWVVWIGGKLARLFGGLNGDMYGTLIESSEILLLHLAILGAAWHGIP